MLNLTPELISNKEFYDLLSKYLKPQFMPQFEDFSNCFSASNGEYRDNNFVNYLYENDSDYIALMFFPYGIPVFFKDKYRKNEFTNKLNSAELFCIEFQKIFMRNSNDLEYFEYLKRKNRYTLELFKDKIKENKPRANIFNAIFSKEFKSKRSEYKEKALHDYQELEKLITDHINDINSKISDLSK